MKPPQTLTFAEAEGILLQLKIIRDRLMAMLMLDAGLRVGEVVQLLITDLWINGKSVNTLCITADIAKNKNPRMVPLTKRLQDNIALLYGLKWQWWVPAEQHYAFFIRKPDRHITARQVQRIIKSAAIQSIGRAVHPHVLRHTFATRLMRCTDSRTLQLLLGHKNLSSTQIYAHPNQEDLNKAIKRLEEHS